MTIRDSSFVTYSWQNETKLKRFNSFNTRQNFYEDHQDAFKLKQISKKSERIMNFAKEQNNIQTKRLNFLNSLLQKSAQQTSSNIKLKKDEISNHLLKIKETTNDLQTRNKQVDIKKESNLESYVEQSINYYQKSVTTLNLKQNSSTSLSCKYLTNSQSSRLSNSSNESFDCQYYPCAPIRSYTSIIGPKNDRYFQADTSWPVNSSIQQIKSSLLGSGTRSKYNITDEEIDDIANKSFKRTYTQSASAKSIKFRVRALETQINTLKKHNHENYEPVDRNILYGKPYPTRRRAKSKRAIRMFL